MIYNSNPFEIGPGNRLTQEWHICYVAPIIFGGNSDSEFL